MSDEQIFTLSRGTRPLLLSVPHAGEHLPDDIAATMVPEARQLADTDFYVDELYDFAHALGASVLVARVSRYAIDLNRPPDGTSLYPGQATTGLCPDVFFDGRPLYRDGATPTPEEIGRRRVSYWQPYHDALRDEIRRLRDEHGSARLYDAHSIRSVVPRLFEGTLPDLNLGTARGASCGPALRARLESILRGADSYSSVIDGRFVGGYITRHYGQPERGIDAVQMELAQTTYMDEDAPAGLVLERADRLRRVLRALLTAMLE